jgi:hypothetical protein
LIKVPQDLVERITIVFPFTPNKELLTIVGRMINVIVVKSSFGDIQKMEVLNPPDVVTPVQN